MLNAVFQDREIFLFALLAISLACGILTYWVTRKHELPSYAIAAFIFCLAIAIGVTVFIPGGGGASHVCTVNKDIGEPFRTEQGLLNAAMCVPLGLFSVLAFRRIPPIIACGVMAPAVVELSQATIPWISRNCDSSDAQMNTIGVFLGAGMGYAVLKMQGSEIAPWNHGAKPLIVTSICALTVCTFVWNLAITPIAVDSTSLQIAGGGEKDAARAALNEAFNDRYSPVNVQVQPGYEGGSETLLIALPDGSATLSWPDKANFNVSLESSSVPGPGSFPVVDTAGDPKDSDDAYVIAQRYANEHYEWALKGSDYESYPVGDGAEFGWLVSWRKVEGGVLMPMRLDVQINRAGRVSQLNVQRGPLSVPLPPRRVNRDQAESIVKETLPKGSGAKIEAGRLAAVQKNGEWRAQWAVSITVDESDPYEVYVDAETGNVSP
ncbi:VanZ family protein [Streptomyces sp. NPDC002809]|uniref:VanZ family protein n=1 Tax=Streptomyces sp. NPDC002809 TaxID=3154433 RepID=UPI00331690E1